MPRVNEYDEATIIRPSDFLLLSDETANREKKVLGSTVANQIAMPAMPRVGLTCSNDAGDLDHDIKTKAGYITDSTGTRVIVLPSDIIKQIDAVWAPGTNQGGLPSGDTLLANKSIHYFMIMTDAGVTDTGWSYDLDATSLRADATNYTIYKRLLSFYIDGSLHVTKIVHVDDLVMFDQAIFVTGTITASLVDVVLPVPLNIYSEAILAMGLEAAAGLVSIAVKSTFLSAEPQPLVANPGEFDRQILRMIADQEGKISHLYSGTAPADYELICLGWREFNREVTP